MITAHIFISGFVQGVGFRQFIKINVERLGLTGWVRNTLDGRVEAVLQGRRADIDKMVKLCHKGPFLAEVKTLAIEQEETERVFEGFEIIT